MISLHRVPGCCGVREIHNLSSQRSPAAAIADLGHAVYQIHRPEYHGTYGDNRWRYAFFSAAGSKKPTLHGERLKAYILKHNLGEVIETGVHRNPNSGNQLKMYVWTIDHDATKAHCQALYEASQKGKPKVTNPGAPVANADLVVG